MRTRLVWLASLVVLLSCVAGCATPRTEPTEPAPAALGSDAPTEALEGEAHGYPALRTLAGKTLADGEFTQWLEGERLHVEIRYTFGPQHSIEEASVIRQEPTLVQERWSWTETLDGGLRRRFAVDFLAGEATAEKLEKGTLRHWSKHVDVVPGQAFAGSIWALAVKGVRPRLLRGEKVQFQTVGFTPAPRAAKVEITYDGLDQLPMAGRKLVGDRFRIHPRVPWIARPFVHVPDSRIWLANPPPAAFLRFEGPLAEPDDALVRVDLLPGEPSGAASPATP